MSKLIKYKYGELRNQNRNIFFQHLGDRIDVAGHFFEGYIDSKNRFICQRFALTHCTDYYTSESIENLLFVLMRNYNNIRREIKFTFNVNEDYAVQIDFKGEEALRLMKEITVIKDKLVELESKVNTEQMAISIKEE